MQKHPAAWNASREILLITTIVIFYVSAASDTSITSSSERSDDNNPEPAPERVRHSRGGGSKGIEAAAGESDDD